MISIIIPVFNTENHVAKCINSILNQTYKDYEIILIDDGSTDNSRSICESYKSDRVIFYHQENLGVSAARNKGLELSRGDEVIFVDSDDWLDPEMLEKLEIFKGDSDLSVCAYNIVKKGTDETIIIDPYNPWGDYSKGYVSTDAYHDVLLKSAVLWNKLISKRAIGNTRFDTNCCYGEDALFLCKVIGKVSKATIVPFCLYNYCINREGNVVSSRIGEKTYNYIDTATKIYLELVAQGRPAIGVARIAIVVNDVLSKIELTMANIKANKNILIACWKLANFPERRHLKCFIKDRTLNSRFKRRFLFIRRFRSFFYMLAFRRWITAFASK